ncbi:MAG: cell division protein FtsZ [Candidatus Hydrogenedentota bacterium]
MAMGISDEFSKFERNAVIKVCGVGGGGGNAVGRMIAAGLSDVEFITINTDAQALKNSPAGTRLQIGESGLGAGAKPEVGRAAAEADRQRVAEVLQGADMIFLTAGMGGGTGTGATPVVAEVAKETGALTVAIVTLPFQFEGQGRMENAMKGMALLEKHVDALIVVPNDRLALLCNDNITFLNAFKLADEVLHNGVRSISELITVPGLINLDFADVRTIMQGSGRALMGIGTAEGDKRAIRAAQEAIVCPLLEKSSVDGAMGVIVNVKGGSNMGMREVLEAVTTVQRAAHSKANIIFGAVVEDDEDPTIQVTVIAAGFAMEFIQPVQPFTETVSLSLEVDDDFEPRREAEPILAPVNVEPLFSRSEPIPALGEQFMFSAEELAPQPEYVNTAHAIDQEEDLGIPAFMRKRMRR